MHGQYLNSLKTIASLGAGGAIIGAIGHQELLTWCGVLLAIASAVVSAFIAAFHKLKVAFREERSADHALELIRARDLALVQSQFVHRVNAMDQRLARVEGGITATQCLYPRPDGSPSCLGMTPLPPWCCLSKTMETADVSQSIPVSTIPQPPPGIPSDAQKIGSDAQKIGAA